MSTNVKIPERIQRAPRTLRVERRPTPQVEQMIDDAKLGLSHQLAQYRQRMQLETLEPKEMQAFAQCITALEKLARLEGVGVASYDLSALSDEQLDALAHQSTRILPPPTPK